MSFSYTGGVKYIEEDGRARLELQREFAYARYENATGRSGFGYLLPWR